MFLIDFNKYFKDINIKKYKSMFFKILKKIEKEKNNKNNNLGWIDYLDKNKNELFKTIKIGKILKRKYDILVVIGSGGSFLGSKSIYEMLKYRKKNILKNKLFFIGNNLSGIKLKKSLTYLKDKNFCVNVISKSGKTLETSIAFRFIENILKNKYGKKYIERIIFTTDKKNYKLKEIMNKKGIQILEIPSNIGGRYSVFTSVGILPLTFAGFDIEKLFKGIINSKKIFFNLDIENPVFKYALFRNLLFEKKYYVEFLTIYDETLYYFIEWLKQLFGESEGKDGKGIYPISVINTKDLHSLGQFIQEGVQKHFETIFWINEEYECLIPFQECDFDNLNYLKNISIDMINKKVMLATRKSHNKINIPNLLITINKLDEEKIGEIYYFFMIACTISCYFLNVNPFNQPGVEKYKKEVKKMLKKLSFNKIRKDIK